MKSIMVKVQNEISSITYIEDLNIGDIFNYPNEEAFYIVISGQGTKYTLNTTTWEIMQLPQGLIEVELRQAKLVVR